MQDPVYLNFGLMPPIFQPLNTPSKMTNVPDDYIHTHSEFEPNLPVLFMTPTDNKFQIPLDRTTDHYVSYASRNLPQLQHWQDKKLKFFFLQYNFLKPTAADPASYPSETTPASVKRLHHRTSQTFLQLKTPQTSSSKITDSLLRSHFWDTTILTIKPLSAIFAITILSNKHFASCLTKTPMVL